MKSSLKWAGIAVGGLIVIALLVLAFMDWNLLKHPIERMASASSGRTVRIAGDLNVHIWSWTPTVTVNGLSVGNPPWEIPRPMVKIERLQVQLKLLPLLKGDVILPRVELIKPEVYLHQDLHGRANWTFESTKPTNAPNSKPTKLPAVRDFLIQSGKLTLLDDVRKLKVEGTVEAHEAPSKEDPTPFRIQGKGSLNAQPFAMQIAGGPLVNLDPEHPYPFAMKITAGSIEVRSDGRVLKPFDLAELNFEVDASGKDLAELFYLTQLALPNTPPFKLHAHIARHGMNVAVTDIAGAVGSSDLGGHLDIDATRKRPSISGELVSNRLLMSDLAASVGGKPKQPGSLDSNPEPAKQPLKVKQKEKAPPPDPNARLFPDARLQVNRVRAMDADVSFRAKSIVAGSVPFKQVALHLKLDDGVLLIDPFSFEMPQGQITGSARIDARKDIPAVRLDVRVKDIQLDQLKGKAADSAPPLGGVMQARAVIQGSGDSLHSVMADANGDVTVILPNGEVRSAFAELTGINIANGIGLLLKGDNDRSPIRCGVAQFKIADGTMTAETVVFDTQNVLITGKGDIRLGPEKLNLSIKGDPKKVRLTRLRSPVEIKGTLLDPSIGIDPGSAIKQGAIAAALGTLLTPLAAVIAFVDPGLAKDQNCAALLAETESKSGSAPLPASAAVTTPAPEPETKEH